MPHYNRNKQRQKEKQREILRYIGYQIRKHRLQLGLTEADLGKLAGTTQDVIHLAEYGKHAASILTFIKIAAALQVTIDTLIETAPKEVYVNAEMIAETRTQYTISKKGPAGHGPRGPNKASYERVMKDFLNIDKQ